MNYFANYKTKFSSFIHSFILCSKRRGNNSLAEFESDAINHSQNILKLSYILLVSQLEFTKGKKIKLYKSKASFLRTMSKFSYDSKACTELANLYNIYKSLKIALIIPFHPPIIPVNVLLIQRLARTYTLAQALFLGMLFLNYK